MPNTDYKNVSYSNNTIAGTASVSVTGKGNYSGRVYFYALTRQNIEN